MITIYLISLYYLFVCISGEETTTQFPPQQEEYILAIPVEAGKIECFYQDLRNPKYVAIELDYQVIDGGEHDINFFIRSPSGINVVQDDKKSDGNHRVDILQHGRGDYAICFDNTFSIQSKKTIFWELYMLDEKGNYLNNYDLFADSNKGKIELSMALTDFERITTKVKNNLNRIEQLQAQLRAIEARDRSVMENNFERVNRWSIINLVLMLTVAGLQIYLIRTLFEENSKVGKFIRSGRID